MTETNPTFEQLGLSEPLLKALRQVGYETPTPIQGKSIPALMAGNDILGQAQTGTGKTAAFALPVLDKINVKQNHVQAMVLTPTRELAIQVAEAFQTYAKYMTGFHILPIYGGQGYDTQIRSLKRGVQIVVGTPGRIMDHIRKGTLKLDQLDTLVLDEADEMLRMGFIDDVEWILTHTPDNLRTALFSATMPKEIERVANNYLKNPVHVRIESTSRTAPSIKQRFWSVSGLHKLDAMTRILEIEPFDAMIVFVRTKTATVELAEKLEARGYRSSPLNGDISQAVRERTVDRLKKGKIDILVATDVAARGLDVERISHVLNYDIPYDTEAYVHRIGRTGRAGRSGEAILFVGHRERRMLKAIERATGQPIESMEMPSHSDINDQRVQKFRERIKKTMDNENIEFFHELVTNLSKEEDISPMDIAASLAKLYQGDQPFLLPPESQRKKQRFEDDERPERSGDAGGKKRVSRSEPLPDGVTMMSYRVEVGKNDGVSPGNLVGAIANEGGLEGRFIRNIRINADHSTLELPGGMPAEVFKILAKARVCHKPLNITTIGNAESDNGTYPQPAKSRKKPGRAKPFDGPRKPRSDKKSVKKAKKNDD